MLVLFWLGLWEIFHLPRLGFELRSYGSIVLNCTTVPWQLIVFTSDNFQVFKSGAEELGWYFSDWTCERFFFVLAIGFELWTSGSLFPHCTTVPWQLLIFTSDNLRYLTLVQRDWWWYCSDWTCERFSFFPHQGLNWGPALYHCTIVTSSFTSDNFRYSNLVWRDIGWYCSDWTCERFSFGCTGVWSGDLWIYSPVLYQCTMVTSHFHLWQFEVFYSDAEGLMLVLFRLDLWEIFLLPTVGFEVGTCGCLVLHSTTAPWWLLFFTSFNLRYLTLVQEGLVMVLFWLDLWEIFFLPTPGFELGTCGSLVLHSTTVPWQLLDFTSDILRYLTLVQGDCWHIVLIGSLRDFLFAHSEVWNGDLWISSSALYLCGMATSGFHLWWFEVFNSGVEGLVVLLFWLDLW